jgi:hypothetical protein
VAHSIGEFAASLAGFEAGYLLWEHEALEHAGKIVEEEAKRVIGTYDYGWPELAESTQMQREHLGYSANEPLLRDGTHIRDTIEHTVVDLEHACYVGTNSKIAVYQELGTSRIPPRSFLAGAARAKEHEIHEEISHSLHLSLAAALGIKALSKKP